LNKSSDISFWLKRTQISYPCQRGIGKYYRIGIVDPVTPPNGREIEAENPAGGNIGEEINEGGNNQGGAKGKVIRI